MNVLDMVPDDKREETPLFIKKLQTQDKESFETQRVTKDDKKLNVSFTATRLVDEDGKPVAIDATERDITVSK